MSELGVFLGSTSLEIEVVDHPDAAGNAVRVTVAVPDTDEALMMVMSGPEAIQLGAIIMRAGMAAR